MTEIRTAFITAVCMAWATSAAAIELACVTKNPSSKDWVPEAVLVKIDPNTWRAAVLDEFTLQVFDGGAIAELARPTPKRINLTWKVAGLRDNQDKVQNVNFKMTINMTRMTFNYNGLGESFFVTPGSASGHCVAAK